VISALRGFEVPLPNDLPSLVVASDAVDTVACALTGIGSAALAMVGDMRLVLWWAGSAASIVLVDASLMNESGSGLDSADAAASSGTTTGSGGLILVGPAA